MDPKNIARVANNRRDQEFRMRAAEAAARAAQGAREVNPLGLLIIADRIYRYSKTGEMPRPGEPSSG